jgi:hypothetical protein
MNGKRFQENSKASGLLLHESDKDKTTYNTFISFIFKSKGVLIFHIYMYV